MKTETGHYEVNGVKFASKLAAILEAQKTQADIKWVFYDDILSRLNWLEEPQMSIDTLYMLRAKQIRESYDYVVVYCSGGADSNNVIRTFMNNGIKVDEVVAMAPLSGLNNWDWNDKDTSPYNTISETKYAQFPILQEIADKDPSIKISILDTFEDMISVKTDEWIYNTDIEYVSPVTKNHGKLDKLTHIKELAESGKRIAAVWGIDKPVISIDTEGNLSFIIADIGTTSRVQHPFDVEYPNVDRVFFYWAHEMPEIMVKQAHIVAREMMTREYNFIYKAVVDIARNRSKQQSSVTIETVLDSLIPYSANWTPPDHVKNSPRSIFQRGIVPIIYPTTYTKNLFQCEKFEVSQSFFVEHQSWFYKLHKNHINMDLITSDFKQFYKSISPKYLNKAGTGFEMYMKKYSIGNVRNFLQTSLA